jgi:hypothetical protein
VVPGLDVGLVAVPHRELAVEVSGSGPSAPASQWAGILEAVVEMGEVVALVLAAGKQEHCSVFLEHSQALLVGHA